MPTLTVNVGKRPYGEFQRVVQSLREFSFSFNKENKTWTRFVNPEFAPEVISGLASLGIRARIDERLSHNT